MIIQSIHLINLEGGSEIKLLVNGTTVGRVKTEDGVEAYCLLLDLHNNLAKLANVYGKVSTIGKWEFTHIGD